jgi:predicted amidohydrolase
VAKKRDRIKAGFFQFNPEFGNKAGNLKKVVASLANLTTTIHLLVLPEFFATGYQFLSREEVDALSENIPEGETTQVLTGVAQEKTLYIIAGLPEQSNRKYFNSAVLIGPDGYIGTYRKTHLFFEEKKYFTPGDTGFQVWSTEIGQIGIMICFDWFFPESMRALALNRAEIVGHPSNLVMPYCPAAMPIRCLENKLFSVTANRTGTEQRNAGQALHFIGQSLIATPEGKILVKASSDTDALMTADIELPLARNKSINSLNDIIRDRRPEMYKNLSEQY